VLVPALYLTSSRGAWIAFATGLLVLLRFGGRMSIRLAAALFAAAVVALGSVVAASGAGENRVHYYRVAWRDFHERPAVGSGAGTFGRYWLAHRDVDLFVRTPHSLYLGSLAELGVVGLALVLVALVPPLLLLRRGRDPVLAGAAAAYVAFLLHAGIDWDWEVPAVTLSGMFCGAGVLLAGRSAAAPSLPVRARLLLIVPLAAVAVVACIRMRSGANLPFGP
jgi:O-antigen ligase